MGELDEIRQKRLQELQNQLAAQQAEQAQARQQIDALERLVKNYLDREATVRYGTLKTAHPELAVQLLVMIANAVESGVVRERLTDAQLKEILKKITPGKKETSITRK